MLPSLVIARFVIGMARGGVDADRYSRSVLAAGHPDMAWISEKLPVEIGERQSQVTRMRHQVVNEAAFAASAVDACLAEADIGPFIFSLRPIGGRAVGTVALFRRREAPPFSEREADINHTLLSEVLGCTSQTGLATEALRFRTCRRGS